MMPMRRYICSQETTKHNEPMCCISSPVKKKNMEKISSPLKSKHETCNRNCVFFFFYRAVFFTHTRTHTRQDTQEEASELIS